MKIIFTLIIGLLVYSCKENINNVDIQTINCNVEICQGNRLIGSDAISYFGDKNSRSNSFAFSGLYSIALDSTHKYGFQKKIYGLKKGEFVKASVWGKSDTNAGVFICSVKHKDSTKVIRKIRPSFQANGWYKYNIEIYVSDDNTDLHFYTFSRKERVYFDDLSIKICKSVPTPNEETKKKISALKLYIPENSSEKLSFFKQKSLQDGIISKKYKQFVSAFLIHQNDSIPIKIKLKGDWTDHLSSGKISYRIKIPGINNFLGLKTFSIQHPKTRNYMHEWFMHKLLDAEALLSTKYEFIAVEINNVYKGVYAIEEHFEKHLLEKRKHSEGPILKMSETGAWAYSLMQFKNPSTNKIPILEASEIASFKKRKSGDYLNRANFDEGVALLQKYKNQSLNTDEIFDIEMLAKYYALLEIGSVEHAHQWHNQRFYFNPICQKLQSIGYDLNPGKNVNADLYVQQKLETENGALHTQLISPALKNKKFKEYYLKYLKIYSNPAYIEVQINQLSNSIELNESLLSLEIDNFKFDENFYRARCKKINQDLPIIDSIWSHYLSNIDLQQLPEENYTPHADNYFLKEVSVNAYISELASKEFQVELINFHLNPVSILGYLSKKGDTIFLKNPLKISGYSKKSNANEAMIITKIKPYKIYFRAINNLDSTIIKKVFNWPKPKKESTRIDLKKQFSTNSKFYQITDSTVIFNSGKLNINQLLYIPKNYKVVFLEGTEIDFINGGGIIINNSVEFNGSKNKRILFYSSDATNNGITILNSNSVSINYVDFEGLKALNYKNWILSGAISIYESNVKMKSVTVRNITSEDAINIIRSHYVLIDLKITNASSDGLDLDFSKGSILNSSLINSNNKLLSSSFYSFVKNLSYSNQKKF